VQLSSKAVYVSDLTFWGFVKITDKNNIRGMIAFFIVNSGFDLMKYLSTLIHFISSFNAIFGIHSSRSLELGFIV